MTTMTTTFPAPLSSDNGSETPSGKPSRKTATITSIHALRAAMPETNARGLLVGGFLVVAALILNAVLTLIAGSRLWAHIFWRPAVESAVVAQGQGEWLRLGSTGALVAVVVAAGLWPNGLFEALRLGAPDLLDPARYVAAIGLAGGTP